MFRSGLIYFIIVFIASCLCRLQLRILRFIFDEHQWTMTISYNGTVHVVIADCGYGGP